MSNADRQQLLRGALGELLLPLARLCLLHGLPFAVVEEQLKRAYVQAARQARADAGGAARRDVSQVSVATGLSRREVTRLGAQELPRAVQRPSPATQLFHLWLGDKRLRGRDGQPRALPRTGPHPSFESLTARVTRHVHARSLLDELLRLKLAELTDDGRTVRLLAQAHVPLQDDGRLYQFLGANVGDHLAAATANVVHRDRRHFEQALFTDELSEPAAQQLRTLARQQWSKLVTELVPAMQGLIDEDKAAGRAATHRARLGLFTFHEPLQETAHEPPPPEPAPRRRARRAS